MINVVTSTKSINGQMTPFLALLGKANLIKIQVRQVLF